MKWIILSAVASVVMAVPAAAQTVVPVKGYWKPSSGTYVEPSMRTSPNSTRDDNWSSKPNVNPYTGERGTRNPDTSPEPRRYNPYGRLK
jgi:hypothetical protein